MTPRQRDAAVAWLKAHRRDLALLTDPPPEKASTLTKDELLSRLRRLRAGWEALTSRSEDLSDERLASESRAELNAHYAWFVSEEARAILARVLGEVLVAVTASR
jgi:hypothetical protein